MKLICRAVLLKTLNQRYGRGNWRVLSGKRYSYTTQDGFVKRRHRDGYQFTVTSDYTLAKPFIVNVCRKHFVTKDYFLPTYFSLKYGLDYEFESNGKKYCNYQNLTDRIIWICRYHYPYRDSFYDPAGYAYKKHGCQMIGDYEVTSIWSPVIVSYFPKKGIEPDIIPNEGRLYSLEEMIDRLEKYYCSNRKKKPASDDKSFYELIFKADVTEKEVMEYLEKIGDAHNNVLSHQTLQQPIG